LNRPDTPGSKRKSLASRNSLAPSMAESPTKPDFFADGMAAQDFEDQVEGRDGAAYAQLEDFHDMIEQDEAEAAAPLAAGETANEEEVTQPVAGSAELTTDLVNFTNASDTAM